MVFAVTKEDWSRIDAGNYKANAEALIGSKHSWEAYKMYCEASYQTRNGTLACGVVESLELDDPYARPEFVSEHMGRTAFLLGTILMWNPYLARRESWAAMLMLALIHDVGEAELGDQLDDGSESHLKSRATEVRVMSKLFANLPKKYQALMRRYWCEFEEYSGMEPSIVKMVDKADAILWQLFLKTKGREGDVRRKHNISDRDMQLAKIIGSYKSTEVWCLHYRIMERKIDSSKVAPITRVLEAAFLDVYGKLPECMTIDVSEIELDMS